jgi:thiol-disulfide isomerase/thioredoxin
VKKRNKVMEIVAWALAGVVLVTSLVYYNFIHKDAEVGEGYEVGCIAPDFTMDIYGSNESFTLSENLDKITIVNFWARWCTPCVAELPYFEEFYSQYGEQVNLIAIHGTAVTEDVDAFIAQKFDGFTITFAQDSAQAETDMNVYNTYGGVNSWPTTVIINTDGKILYNSSKSFHSAQDLIDLITPMLGE